MPETLLPYTNDSTYGGHEVTLKPVLPIKGWCALKRARTRARVRACVRACVRVCVCARACPQKPLPAPPPISEETADLIGLGYKTVDVI